MGMIYRFKLFSLSSSKILNKISLSVVLYLSRSICKRKKDNSSHIMIALRRDERTLSIPNILGLLDDNKDIDKSIMEMITRTPSITFQPEVK